MSLPNVASMLQSQGGEIVRSWTQAVRNDPRIHSDEDLTDQGLSDHVPFMIEEICQVLETGQIIHVDNTREGRVHAYTRYRQGYRARDLISEISLLRLLLLEYTAKVVRATIIEEAFDAYLEAAHVINVYLDEELRYGMSVYTETDRRTEH